MALRCTNLLNNASFWMDLGLAYDILSKTVTVFAWASLFISDCLLRCKCLLTFARNCQTTSWNGCTILRSSIQNAPHLYQPFFISTIPMSVFWYLIMVSLAFSPWLIIWPSHAYCLLSQYVTILCPWFYQVASLHSWIVSVFQIHVICCIRTWQTHSK